jgi:two-component system, OmpR family, sensor histidine kinase KdpD
LSSISHDLRTPLATMIGSVSSLIELHDALDISQQEELLKNTLSEAQRLNRYIQKLLDMTRLGHGELKLDRDWVGVDDILSVVIKRSKALLNGAAIRVDLQPDLPLLHVHPALIEQAVFNVLENAIRYTPADSSITIRAYSVEKQLHIDIHNYGPVIPSESWSSIFDMFFTFAHGDQDSAGTGLGLAICQGIVGAHGGLASVIQSNSELGTTLRISLPLNEAEHSIQEITDDTHTDH